jgi:hypothetical protein
MQRHYDSSYYVVSYLAKIVQNICIDISRDKLKGSGVVASVEIAEAPDSENETAILDTITIREEVRRLDVILRTFYRHRRKIELFLKIYCRIPVAAVDVATAYPASSDADRRAFLAVLGEGSRYKEMMDKEIFLGLSSIINRLENKSSSTDAYRKWLDSKINEIIALLNGKPNYSSFDRETLKLLLQVYFE